MALPTDGRNSENEEKEREELLRSDNNKKPSTSSLSQSSGFLRGLTSIKACYLAVFCVTLLFFAGVAALVHISDSHTVDIVLKDHRLSPVTSSNDTSHGQFTQKVELRHGWSQVKHTEHNDAAIMPWYEVEATQEGKVMTYVNTVPRAMMLLEVGEEKRPVLYCPNAKAATSTVIETFNFSLAHRCYTDCEISAWRLFRNKDSREIIMNPHTFSFTIVRNPWDRIRSTYEGKITSGEIRLRGFKSKIPSFASFLRYVSKYPLENIHWAPFSRRCLVSPNEKDQMFHYDHIVRMEDGIAEGLHIIAEKVGVDINLVSQMFNNTEHGVQARMDWFSHAAVVAGVNRTKLVEKVREIYSDDIATFGYSFKKYN